MLPLSFNKRSHPCSLHSAFTLIELVIVLGIVLILAAIFLSAFAQVREASRRLSCASNLRQIGIALQMYGQDYDGRFAYGGDPCDLNTDGWDYTGYGDEVADMMPLNEVLAPYVSDSQVWHCPSDTGYTTCGISDGYHLAAHPSGFVRFGMSYAYDTYLPLLHESLSGVTAWGKNSPHPSYGPDHIILMQDTNGFWHRGQVWEGKRYNVLFCDGHVHSTTHDQDSDLWNQTFTLPASP